MSYTGTPGNDTNTATGGTIVGLEGSDSLTGDDTPNTMFGNQNNDTLVANGQNDTVYAGQNDDMVSAGFGFDVIYGNEGSDTLLGNQDNDTIYGGNDSAGGGDTSSDTLIGGRGSDLVVGAGGNDNIVGNEDNDTLIGNGGNDWMFGNENNDTLFGGGGNDNLIGGKDNDSLGAGDGNDTLAGNEGSDGIRGGAGNDVALYTGNSGRYNVTFDAGLLALIVTDSTGENGADTVFDDVETLLFDDGARSFASFIPTTPSLTVTHIDGPLPANFVRADGTYPAGSDIPNDSFERIHVDVSGPAEDPDLVWNLRYRQSMTALINPVSHTLVGNSLELVYNVAAGTQSTANGSDVDNPDRAASSDQPLLHNDTLAELLAEGVVIERFYDTDPGPGETLFGIHASYEPLLNRSSGIVWRRNDTDTLFILDDGTGTPGTGGEPDETAGSFNRMLIPGFTAAQLVAGAEFDDYFRISYGVIGTAQIHMEMHLV